MVCTKAELPQVGRYFFFALNFLPWEFLLIKKLEIEKTKPTFIIWGHSISGQDGGGGQKIFYIVASAQKSCLIQKF